MPPKASLILDFYEYPDFYDALSAQLSGFDLYPFELDTGLEIFIFNEAIIEVPVS